MDISADGVPSQVIWGCGMCQVKTDDANRRLPVGEEFPSSPHLMLQSLFVAQFLNFFPQSLVKSAIFCRWSLRPRDHPCNPWYKSPQKNGHDFLLGR